MARCAVHLQDHSSIRAGYEGHALNSATVTAQADPSTRSTPFTNGYGGSAAIEYGGEYLGALEWTAVERGDDIAFDTSLLHDLAWCIACQLNRRRLRADTSARLGREFILVGVSDDIHRLEYYIDRAARVDLPTLVCGEFGTEKLQVACAIHFSGRQREGPFVELRCATLHAGTAESALSDRFSEAQGGTLFLNGIDELQPEPQAWLLRLIESRVGQWIDYGGGQTVRLIASTIGDLHQQVEAGTFSEALCAELGFLTIKVPPLRVRPDDLRYLIEYTLTHHNGAAGECDADVLAAFDAYDWPQNLFELERIMRRLVVMGRSQRICLEDLEELAPQIVSGAAPHVASSTAGAAEAHGKAEHKSGQFPLMVGDDNLLIEQVARRVLSGEFDDLKYWHAGVLRALRYIGEHYADAMTLSELADAAYVSPSHLCYLLRSTLGVTFKGILGLVRIERAKQLLVDESERRITDISLHVGFGDLSHFEKTFKRNVNVSPREYRRRRLQELRERARYR